MAEDVKKQEPGPRGTGSGRSGLKPGPQAIRSVPDAPPSQSPGTGATGPRPAAPPAPGAQGAGADGSAKGSPGGPAGPGPNVKVVEVAPAAKPARMQLRHWMVLLSLVVVTVLPAAATGIYLYGFAADQYASTVGFTVRKEETNTPLDILGGLSLSGTSSSTDTDILYEFIQSQELVRAVDAELDLREIYGKPAFDPVFTLDADASIEELVAYWKNMVKIFYDPGTGLIEVEVRAFDPQDAQTIAKDIFDRSSKMINELSAVARADTTRYAKADLEEAKERLKAARQALTKYRNEKQIVDPSADIQGQMGLLNSLNAQLASAIIELDVLSDTTRDSDPRVEQARRRIAVIKQRIEEERRKLGVSGSDDVGVFADVVGKFESLQTDLEFEQKSYLSALAAYDGAVAEARRQSRYLAAYVQPTLAQTPQYPRRATTLLVITLLLFGIWTISVLVYYSLKDRR